MTASGAVPDWLDELSLEAGPPWLSMGTRSLELERWLVVDADRERDLAWKDELLRDRFDEVFAALATPAVAAASAEVLAMVVDAVGAQQPATGQRHPLDAAGRMVQEDLCLLVAHDDGYRLDAASLCFPSYWRLADKLGRSAATIHAPVPHYTDELAAKVDSFLRRLRPGRPVWRRNWSIHDDPSYFLPDATTPRATRAPEGLYLRSERQTLRRLELVDAVLFTIRTQQVDLDVLAARPDVAHRMASAIRAWSPEMAAYKGGNGALLAEPWLASV